jgi:hypothetical protein
MATTQAFQPMGNSFIITTSGTASTSQSTLVTLTGSGNLNLGNNQPANIRIRVPGASDIWFSITAATGTAAIPTAGTTTTGTPTNVQWVGAGSERVFTLNVGGPSFYINTVTTGTSVNLWCQLGEGQ